jgi:hypothetical protein
MPLGFPNFREIPSNHELIMRKRQQSVNKKMSQPQISDRQSLAESTDTIVVDENDKKDFETSSMGSEATRTDNLAKADNGQKEQSSVKRAMRKLGNCRWLDADAYIIVWRLAN